jgi:hypothetical protein
VSVAQINCADVFAHCRCDEDADVIDDGNYCFITTPLGKSKWKAIPAAVNYPEYLWMGSLENQTVALGAARGCVSTLPNTNGLDLVTDPFSLGDYGQIRVVCTRLLRSYNPSD